MKNILVKTVLATSLVASSMFAENLFMGAEASYQQSKAEDFKDKVPSLGLKVGYDFDMYRVYGEYKYTFEAKDEYFSGPEHNKISWKTHDILIGADYTPSITDNFKFVVGAFGGYSKVKAQHINNILAQFENGKFSKNGWKIGAKIGGIYEVNSQNEVEFGIKADYAKYSKTVFNKIKTYGAYVGYNYKF